MKTGNYILFGLYIALAFLFGFLSASWMDGFSGSGLTGRSIDVPSDHFDSKDILVYDDRVVIKVQGAKVTGYDSTGSMLPTLGSGINGISVIPKSEGEISVGDIVSHRKGGEMIVHRVIEKGVDEEGTYFITRGDNSPVSDGKIRFDEIERVLVGLVY